MRDKKYPFRKGAFGKGVYHNAEIGRLMGMGLTFYKKFVNAFTLTADFAYGLGTSFFTSSRSATTPATYVDSNGVVTTVTTSDIPRFQGGYYDATGFHAGNSGIMIEAAGTNLVPKSKVFNDAVWSATTMTVTDNDILSPDGTTNAGTLTASAGNGNILLTTAVTAQTFSVWLKRKTGTGTINITANGGTTWTAVTLTSSWCRFQVTAASASQTCGIQIVTNADAVYIWGAQFENTSYATSFIPTTTAALTRNAEVLKYAISGNRTVAQETFICKFMSDSSFANDGINRFICDTGNSGVSTVDGALLKTTTGTVIFHSPESSRGYSGVTNILGNVSYIVSGLFFGNTGNPNARLYLNSVLESTQNSDMISSPDFGSFFYLGTKGTGVNQLNGSIAWVKIFNRPLTASEIATLQ